MPAFFSIVARELPGLAYHVVAIRLVETSFAIRFTVAFPRGGYARLFVLASNLVGPACTRLNIFGTILFVRAVSTIILAIATPTMRYTAAVGTFKLRFRAISIRTIHLVLAVFAITIQIAYPVFRYAFVIIAFEIIRATCGAVAMDLV